MMASIHPYKSFEMSSLFQCKEFYYDMILKLMPLPKGANRLHQEEEEVCAGGSDLHLRGDHHHHGHERHPRGDEPDDRGL